MGEYLVNVDLPQLIISHHDIKQCLLMTQSEEEDILFVVMPGKKQEVASPYPKCKQEEHNLVLILKLHALSFPSVYNIYHLLIEAVNLYNYNYIYRSAITVEL